MRIWKPWCNIPADVTKCHMEISFLQNICHLMSYFYTSFKNAIFKYQITAAFLPRSFIMIFSLPLPFYFIILSSWLPSILPLISFSVYLSLNNLYSFLSLHLLIIRWTFHTVTILRSDKSNTDPVRRSIILGS